MLKRYLALSLVLLIANVLALMSLYGISSGNTVVSFLDAGQGDGTLVVTPGRRILLIDTGADMRTLKSLGKAMPFLRRSIDVLFITHADADHAGLLLEISKRYAIKNAVLSRLTARDLQKSLDTLKSGGTRIVVVKQGDNLWMGDGSVVQVLLPEDDEGGSDRNVGSLVLKYINEKETALFEGDGTVLTESRLVSRYGSSLTADLLKVAHHGSKTSSSAIFLSSVKPKFGIVSVGKGNRYGHPSAVVIERINKTGAALLRTDFLGSVFFVGGNRGFVFSSTSPVAFLP